MPPQPHTSLDRTTELPLHTAKRAPNFKCWAGYWQINACNVKTVQYTLRPQKTKPDNFSIILFRTDEFFIKFGGLIPESTHDINAVAFPTKP